MTDIEFAAILDDDTKRINDDVTWTDDEDHSPAVEFRVDVESTNGWPLFVKGRYNSAPVSDPVSVWKEFCIEAGIQHNGRMSRPSAIQRELW